jgi:hypothetical protein
MSEAATSLKVDLLVNHDRGLLHVSTKIAAAVCTALALTLAGANR